MGEQDGCEPPLSLRRWSPFTRRAAKPALPTAAMTRSASFCFSQTAFVNRPPEAWLPQLFVLIGRKPVRTGKLIQGPSSKRRARPRQQADTRRGMRARGPASRGLGESAYLERGLAVVVLQFFISTSKQKHSRTAVLQREEEICLQITAHTFSKGACSQGELTGVQRRGNKVNRRAFLLTGATRRRADGPMLSAELSLLQRLGTAIQHNL